MPPFIFLFLFHLKLQRLFFGAQFLKSIISAAPEFELSLIKMQDLIDRLVQEIAIMADDDERVRIACEIIHQPERAFEIEVIRWLVEQEKIRL